MIPLIIETICIWIFLFMCLSGVGLLFCKLFKNDESREIHVFNYFWLGWVLCIGILQIWHLFFPVDSLAFVVILIISLFGHCCSMNKWKFRFDSISILWILVGAVLLIWLANRSLSPNLNEDSGLYHLGLVKWFSEYPIIPGLGNIHGRLAFNNSSLLFSSLVDAGIWSQPALRIGNSLIIAVAFLHGFFNLFYKSSGVLIKKPSFHSFFTLLTTPVLFFVAFSAIGLDTDIPVIVLGIVVTSHFVTTITNKSASYFDYILIVLLGSAGFTLKLSFGFLCFWFCIVAIFYAVRFRVFKILSMKCLSLVLVASLFIIPFFVRGYIMSGYPAFPSTAAGIDVEWKVPEEEANHQAFAIMSFARDPQYSVINRPDDMYFSNWFLSWLEFQFSGLKEKWMVTLPFILGSLGLFLQFYLRVFRFSSNAFWFIPFVTSLLFWFWAAPSPRFAGIIFWFYCAMSLFPLLNLLCEKSWFRYFTSARCCFGLIFIFMLLLGFVGKPNSLYTKPGDFCNAWPVPPVEYNKSIIESVEVSEGSDEVTFELHTPSNSRLPWGIPIPSAPGHNHYLRSKSLDIKDGFVDLRWFNIYQEQLLRSE